MKKIEILAPAGSFESMVGAFSGGADAVYMGGQKFGARAYAQNPDENGLLEAIDYAHIHGKQLYLTVNTLLKDRELEKELYAYLAPLYTQGLDAVLVQDMGTLCAIREWFPELPVHASTQMTVVSPDHARQLKSLGVTRIVPARELSLDEVRQIKEVFQGEIECFVHGAMCYCYSGQCLLSSMIGGRSGNRGRCAQPCRLPYSLYDGEKQISSPKAPYLLSLKDMCALEYIPALCQAGVDSFKIEGRMKRPEYAAFVSYVYRKYTDLYLSAGKEGYHVDPEDVRALMELYNRGGFCKGYYKQHNGPEMMTFSRPNHQGHCVGSIKRRGKTPVFEPSAAVGKDDVLLPEGGSDKEGMTVKEAYVPGRTYPVAQWQKFGPGTKVYRIYNASLIDAINKQFLSNKNQEKIHVSLTLFKDFPAKIELAYAGFCAKALGPVVETASKHPLVKADVAARISKTGNTPFCVGSVDVAMDDDAYLSVTGLNQLRRDGIEALICQIKGAYARELPQMLPKAPAKDFGCLGRSAGVPSGYGPERTALVSRLDQAAILAQEKLVSRVYLEPWLVGEPGIKETVRALKQQEMGVFLALPHIFRIHSRKRWHELKGLLTELDFDGYLVRNMETLEFVKDEGLLDGKKTMISDGSLYTMNRRAVAYFQSLGIDRTTVPVELNSRELAARGCEGEEMIVYGYPPLMITAQCLWGNVHGCNRQSAAAELSDRTGRRFPVRNVCGDCYNLIYNSLPLVLYDQEEKLDQLSLGAWRYNFTYESPQMVRRILSNPHENILKAFTRGHFNRGVE
ncbi:MAG TPA: U32 family peptidase [Candidatus Scybalocola faecigallinarum]|uniref:U32 family peptidase n=1 Tax=Candidatus Scybalocola faecigallinarum TaxID=2840941 RepID=A0A9D1F6F1_9FIRM|nr:U32 family peptidase [Candidatus Scybalocola faecigallinarum]